MLMNCWKLLIKIILNLYLQPLSPIGYYIIIFENEIFKHFLIYNQIIVLA